MSVDKSNIIDLLPPNHNSDVLAKHLCCLGRAHLGGQTFVAAVKGLLESSSSLDPFMPPTSNKLLMSSLYHTSSGAWLHHGGQQLGCCPQIWCPLIVESISYPVTWARAEYLGWQRSLHTFVQTYTRTTSWPVLVKIELLSLHQATKPHSNPTTKHHLHVEKAITTVSINEQYWDTPAFVCQGLVHGVGARTMPIIIICRAKTPTSFWRLRMSQNFWRIPSTPNRIDTPRIWSPQIPLIFIKCNVSCNRL